MKKRVAVGKLDVDCDAGEDIWMGGVDDCEGTSICRLLMRREGRVEMGRVWESMWWRGVNWVKTETKGYMKNIAEGCGPREVEMRDVESVGGGSWRGWRRGVKGGAC